ncbi:MAG: DUF4157 domain-containing protein [Pyrinomonadaceae bacterium]
MQRKCACSGGAHECAACDGKSSALQRSSANQFAPAAAAAAVPPIVHDVLRSSGAPLDRATRARMESRFGHDFGRVRVHSDERATESARAVRARAYTVGRDIVFGGGQYAPYTATGQRLLAHEMSHILQQRGTKSDAPTASALHIGPAGDASEREAEAAANHVASPARMSGQHLIGEGARLQRQPDEAGTLRQRDPITGQRESDPLPYREAMDATEQGLYQEYQRDCAGVTTLKRLEPFVRPQDPDADSGAGQSLVDRTEYSPREIVQRLERRVKGLPNIFRLREAIKEEIKRDSSKSFDERVKEESANPLAKRIRKNSDERELPIKLLVFDKQFIEPEFGPDYALGSLEDELVRAKCELSKARWEFIVATRRGRVPGRIPRGR